MENVVIRYLYAVTVLDRDNNMIARETFRSLDDAMLCYKAWDEMLDHEHASIVLSH